MYRSGMCIKKHINVSHIKGIKCKAYKKYTGYIKCNKNTARMEPPSTRIFFFLRTHLKHCYIW